MNLGKIKHFFTRKKHSVFLEVYQKIEQEGEQLMGMIPAVRKRRRLALAKKILWSGLYFISFVILLLVIVLVINFYNLKSVYQNSMTGRVNLELALSYVKSDDFDKAIYYAKTADDQFANALSTLGIIQSGYYLKYIPVVGGQLADIEYLLKTADVLSQTSFEVAGFGRELESLLSGGKKLSFAKFTTDEKRLVLDRIYKSSLFFSKLKLYVDTADFNLNKIHRYGILWPLNSKIEDLRDKVVIAKSLLQESIPLSKIMPILAGYPEPAHYLFLLENSDELRPTGGFMGTYGILEMAYGDIIRFDTHDIYHMDMPVQDFINIIPPEPIKIYLNKRWYLRDANWSPDWPTAVDKIKWFYAAENKLLPPKNNINNFDGEFDGVIAITPKVVTDLLKITGPIIINNEVYDDRNFNKLLEQEVEIGFKEKGISSWDRKSVIGEIIKEMKIRLFNMPATRWQEIVDIVDANLINKNVLLNLKNKETNILVQQQGWGGEVKQTLSDYLMIVDANLGSTKTDAAMQKKIAYHLQPLGSDLIAKVVLDYTHSGAYDWRTTQYRDYVRIYVPQGSELISVDGVANNSAIVANELGKTYFGVFFAVEPGTNKKVTFEYRLPRQLVAKIKKEGYEMYFQKQPGSRVDNLNVDAAMPFVIKSYSQGGNSTNIDGTAKVRWIINNLEADKVFTVSN